jgi:hypothetical protein
MGKLKLYDINTPRETIVEERDAVYLSRTPEQRFLVFCNSTTFQLL